MAANYQEICRVVPAGAEECGRGSNDDRTWHDAAGRKGFVIFEANSVAPVQRYIGLWNALCDAEITPVVDDEEATVVYRQIIADHNA